MGSLTIPDVVIGAAPQLEGYGAYIGMNVKTVPEYRIKARRTSVAVVALGDGRINDDINPVHILYDILVTHLEIATTRINVTSFIDAATTLATERIGLSLLMTRDKTAKGWIDDILRHIDGVLYYDTLTVKFELKLIRDDYDLETIPKITEANSYDIKFERQSWADTFNTFIFKYNDVDAKEEQSHTIINTAHKKTVGQTKAKTIEFLAVTNMTTLGVLANRSLRKLSYPLASIQLTVSIIDFPDLHIGDVVNLTHGPMDVADMAIRVLAISGDKEDDLTLIIEGVEDYFSIADSYSIIAQGGLSIPTDWSVGVITNIETIDTPPEFAIDVKDIIPMYAVSSGTVLTSSVKEKDAATPYISQPPWFLGELSATFSIGDPIDLIGFQMTDLSGLFEMTCTSTEWQQMKYLCRINDEIMIYQTITDTAGTFYVTNVIRAVLGTQQGDHIIGDKVWIFPEGANSMSIANATTTLEVTPQNSRNTGTTVEHGVTYGFSGFYPYSPANPEGSRNVNDITLIWNPTKRQYGATYYSAANIPAGQDEGIYEGVWEVSWDSTTVTVTTPTFAQTEAIEKTYTIKTVLGSYKSPGVQVTI